MRKILLFGILWAVLVSCGLSKILITPTLHPTSTVQVNTLASPTQATKPTSTVTSVLSSGFQKVCLNIEKAPIKEFAFVGKILLSTSEINRIDRKIYTLSQADNLSVLVNEAYGDLIISPDSKRLAYNFSLDDQADQGTKSFKIISFDGKSEQEISYGTVHYDLRGWLDNNRIILYSYTKNLLVLDISTGETDEIDITSPDYGIGTDGFGYKAINHALDRMIYYRSLPVYEFPSIVLWDLENKKEIWRQDIRAELLWHDLVQWSPDNTNFVVAGPVSTLDAVLELFMVNRNGQAKQITHFKEAGLDHAMIDHPTWSPDGRYIAFWLENSLAVFDSITKKVTDYCVFVDEPGVLPSHLYWSPDSKQIVLHGSTNPFGLKPVVIVNIEANKAVEIAGNEYSLEGWMVESP